VFVLDGSALELEHCPELAGKYPSACNQHGRGHWPVLRIVVLHDVQAGLAQPPWWGPMYGVEAVSEQDLGEQAMSSLPAEAVVARSELWGPLGRTCSPAASVESRVALNRGTRAQTSISFQQNISVCKCSMLHRSGGWQNRNDRD
jgi:hypothetical protein